ncbi:hypothetical protein CSUI_000234 [Cystoisospora suis]|uniref:Transmembrane protein n=1 Tax=Cystoisospora suis TaxID=483139 RepID=A0A2C6LH86_9APIC|nr:hypothetical protein CSUI_000234 [Cystoisospora suis]
MNEWMRFVYVFPHPFILFSLLFFSLFHSSSSFHSFQTFGEERDKHREEDGVGRISNGRYKLLKKKTQLSLFLLRSFSLLSLCFLSLCLSISLSSSLWPLSLGCLLS